MLLLTTEHILSLVAGAQFPLTLKMSNLIKVRFILRSITLWRFRLAYTFFFLFRPAYITELHIYIVSALCSRQNRNH